MARRVSSPFQRRKPAWPVRPGRPTDPSWDRRPKIPMSARTETRLVELARLASSPGRKVSPMQVAAHLLEEAVTSCFRDRPSKGRAGA